MDKKYDVLKLENQLCFPLYAASKEIIRKYTPLLKEIDLTYTQYIAMMVLWEKKEISVRELGEHLFLDSGTLTPLLRSLESKGYVTRKRSEEDQRVLMVSVTQKGTNLRERAVNIPYQLSSCVTLQADEAAELYRLLYKILGGKTDDRT